MFMLRVHIWIPHKIWSILKKHTRHRGQKRKFTPPENATRAQGWSHMWFRPPQHFGPPGGVGCVGGRGLGVVGVRI